MWEKSLSCQFYDAVADPLGRIGDHPIKQGFAHFTAAPGISQQSAGFFVEPLSAAFRFFDHDTSATVCQNLSVLFLVIICDIWGRDQNTGRSGGCDLIAASCSRTADDQVRRRH